MHVHTIENRVEIKISVVSDFLNICKGHLILLDSTFTPAAITVPCFQVPGLAFSEVEFLPLHGNPCLMHCRQQFVHTVENSKHTHKDWIHVAT